MRGYYLGLGGSDVCVFVPLSHIFQNYLVEEIGLGFASIHEEQFLLLEYCRIDDLELWFFSFPKSTCAILMSVWYAGPMSVIIIMIVQSSIFKHCALFPDKLCSHCATSSISWWWIFWGKVFHAQKMNHVYELLRVIKSPVSLPLHSTFSPVQLLTDWLTDSCTVCCMLPSYKCCFLPKNKMLYSHSNCWLGNLTYWNVPYLGGPDSSLNSHCSPLIYPNILS